MGNVTKLVEVECKVVHQTMAAYLINHDGNEKNNCWIPISQIEDYCEEPDGTITSIFIPEWLAKSKGLI